MASRRALIIAPLYDGNYLQPLGGTNLLVERLEPVLKEKGSYDARVLSGIVSQTALRRALREAFDTEGEVLVYFYGHGCLRPPGMAILATSDCQPDAEGVPAGEVTLFAEKSNAREVVLILDCCHAGAALSKVGTIELREEAALFIRTAGRAILAACSDDQQGWEVQNETGRILGAFSHHLLQGLHGSGVLPGQTHVTASSLSNYVMEAFHAWNQTPVCLHHETGERKCILTSGLVVATNLGSRKEGLLDRILHSGREPLRMNLPFKPSTTFVGREAELDYLKGVLLDGTRPIAVSATIEGLGGIGKTELILQLLFDAEISKAFSLIVWLDAAGPISPQWVSIAKQLGAKKVPSDSGEILKLIRRKLDEHGRALIVLDNASDWQPLRTHIPDGYPLLVTTRTRDFGGTDFYHRELGTLSDESAREFLTRLVPTLISDPVLPYLIGALGGHALAIELAGYHIKDLCSASEYLAHLRHNQADFSQDVLVKTHYQATVEACLAITWNGLRHDSSRLLWKKAALFAPTSAHRDLLRISFSPDVHRASREISYLLREMQYGRRLPIGEGPDFDPAYAELRAYHVLARVEGYNGERWAMHRLVRDFARKRLQKGEIPLHTMVLANWLRTPSLAVQQEIPHFVAAILDFAREGQSFSQDARFERAIAHRLGPELFSVAGMTEYFREQLDDPRAVGLMFEGLRDINEDVRIAAIRLMEQVGPVPEVLNGLASALDDPEAQVRETASESLARHGGPRTIEVLEAAVRSNNPRAQFAAVKALGAMGVQAQDALRRIASGTDDVLSVEAGTFLAEQGDPTGAEAVLAALQTSDCKTTDMVRYLEALVSLQTETGESLDLLRGMARLLNHPNREIRASAAESLGEIRSDDTVTVLMEVLGGRDPDAKAASLHALGLIGQKAHAALRSVAGGSEISLAIEAATLLAEHKDESHGSLVVSSIEPNLQQDVFVRRLKAIRGLNSKVLNEHLVEVLSRVLHESRKGGSSENALQTALNLAELGRCDGLKILSTWLEKNSYGGERERVFSAVVACLPPRESLKHTIAGLRNWSLRATAISALTQLKSDEIVPDLLNALSDKDPSVRKEIATALGKLADPVARPALKHVAQNDEDKEVRRAASEALTALKKK